MSDTKGYKICTELVGLTPEIIRAQDEEITGDVYMVKRQIQLLCPATKKFVSERECMNCTYNYGRASEKWMYCVPCTPKARGKR